MNSRFSRRLTWSALTLSFLVVSCVTPTATDYVVIERSKEEAPPWLRESKGDLVVDGEVLRFAMMKDQILNLPLGIKQVQLAALAAAEKSVSDTVRKRVTQVAQDKGIALDLVTDQLDGAIVEVVRNFAQKSLEVKDIYYEKLLADQPSNETAQRESYRVAVLISFSKSDFDQVSRELGKRFSQSRAPVLRSLGLLLSNQTAQITTHH